MKKVIFLDRDGTLNRDAGYTHKIEYHEILSGVVDGLAQLQAAGYYLVILTSQSGIGRGMYTEAQYHAFMDTMLAHFQEHNIEIHEHLFCPHHAEEGIGEYKIDCECRKPKPGLVKQAEAAIGPIDYAHSWSIGDAVRDLAMAKEISREVHTILLPKNAGSDIEKELEATTDDEHVDFTANNFLEATQIVMQHS